MTGNTSVEGYPYPLTSDFGDVQDAYRLANAIDIDMRAERLPFRQFLGTPSFVGRQLNTGSAFLTGSSSLQMTVIEWDNTGGAILNNFAFIQPFAQPPSWWMFGCTMLVAPTGTPVVGDLNMAVINVTSVDPVTSLSTTTSAYQRNDDSNTGGEWLNMTYMAPMYQGSAVCQLVLNGSTSKAIQAGSRFWGMCLGPVV